MQKCLKLHFDTNDNFYPLHTFLNWCIANFYADAPMQICESYYP